MNLYTVSEIIGAIKLQLIQTTEYEEARSVLVSESVGRRILHSRKLTLSTAMEHFYKPNTGLTYADLVRCIESFGGTEDDLREALVDTLRSEWGILEQHALVIL